MAEGAWDSVTMEMVIHRVETEDFGVWTCQAKNVYGSSEESFTLEGGSTWLLLGTVCFYPFEFERLRSF